MRLGAYVAAKNAIVERIRSALLVDVEYASRSDKPNEPFSDFQRVISNVSLRASNLRWSPRQSSKGRLSPDAEDEVFEVALTLIVFGKAVTYYCKGFFAPRKNDEQGVEIQSFRKEAP